MRWLFLLVWPFLCQDYSLLHPSLVDQFYRERRQSLFWFAPSKEAPALRQELLSLIDSAAWRGLDSSRYHPGFIRTHASGEGEAGESGVGLDSAGIIARDRVFTDAAIALCKGLYQGEGIGKMIAYDGVFPPYMQAENDFLLDKLIRTGTAGEFREWMDALEPVDTGYRLLKDSLTKALQANDPFKKRQLSQAINAYRWMRHRHFPKFMVVNIASATLRYYCMDSLLLSMKVVVGQAKKRTPRFAAYCDKLVLYPYWNVPRTIALNELLPLFKRSPSLVETMNMQILDEGGRILDPAIIQWDSYDKDHFPYTIRQSTGCDNSLGILKFNLTSPYDVYMHDTNVKTAFLSSRRYFSHGCIRLEKPLVLGNELLNRTLDTAFLRSCLKDQEPRILSLGEPVPVFVVYLRAEADETGHVKYFKDVYHLDK